MKQPPHLLSATHALALLTSGNMTVEQYAQALLKRINARDDTVKAWACLKPDFVLEQARELDRMPEGKRGPLHGLAIGVKDIINTRDFPTQFGSPFYKGYESTFDSSAVAILRAAGALIFGKTTTTEFAVANSGPEITNPHDPRRTPGGSSCGSAAAVADFQVPISLGTQTGGSIIRPASYTGVFAMKPTYGAISPEGQKTFAPTFDTFGFFARTSEDLQLLTDIFAVEDNEQPQDLPLEEISVAVMKTPMWSSAGAGTIAAIKNATTILRDAGVKVKDVPFPSEVADAEELQRIQKVFCMCEGREAFLREYRLGKAKLGLEVRQLVENPTKYSRDKRVKATDTYAHMRRVMNKLSSEHSVILTPSAVDEAPLGLDDMGSPVFNTMWTGFHMPVINVPAFVGTNGMPIGVSLVAPRFRDQHLLRIANVLKDPLISGGGWNVRDPRVG